MLKNGKYLEVSLHLIDANISKRVTKDFVSKNNLLPICEENDNIIVYSCSENVSLEKISFLFNRKIIVKVIEKRRFDYLVSKIFFDVKDIKKIILEEAILENSSDIHIEPGNNDVMVRMRIDGRLVVKRKLLFSEYKLLLQMIKLSANMDITEKRIPQDGKLSFRCNDINYDIRVSSLPLSYGEKIVLRILKKEGFVRSLETISFSEKQKLKLAKMLESKNGLILITGPTGSGKSTTLYSMLNTVKSYETNITTLEDPVEINIEGISQVALNKKLNLDFASGLRSILRQDPDIIMVGEIRDSETAQIAIRASLTGHKVFSTIHTKTPGEVFLRLKDMGVEEYYLKDSINGIVSQRLIRVLCKECKEIVSKTKINGRYINLYKACGCEICNHIGYKSRKIVASVVNVDEYIKDKLDKKEYKCFELENREMISNLLELLCNGDITVFDFKKFIKSEGI